MVLLWGLGQIPIRCSIGLKLGKNPIESHSLGSILPGGLVWLTLFVVVILVFFLSLFIQEGINRSVCPSVHNTVHYTNSSSLTPIHLLHWWNANIVHTEEWTLGGSWGQILWSVYTVYSCTVTVEPDVSHFPEISYSTWDKSSTPSGLNLAVTELMLITPCDNVTFPMLRWNYCWGCPWQHDTPNAEMEFLLRTSHDNVMQPMLRWNYCWVCHVTMWHNQCEIKILLIVHWDNVTQQTLRWNYCWECHVTMWRI